MSGTSLFPRPSARMISTITWISLSLLGAVVLLQVIWAWRFAALFRRPGPSPRQGEALPPAAVILAIRGADPSLAECLEGLLTQHYPAYGVRIVIDSEEDPAWDVVARARQRWPKADVRVSVLKPRRPTCSLKLSALTQAIRELDNSYEVVALIDADVRPHPGWLRDLTAALANPRVGATTGIRWYTPVGLNWGTFVRYVWNAAASSQMVAFRIPWGGSLAFRASVLRDSGLLEQWERSLWEDTATFRALRDAGLRLRFVPSVTMLNDETTDLKRCFQFIRRQMLNVRLYHPSWPAIVAHGFASGGALAATLACLGVALGEGAWGLAACAASGIVAYLVGAALGLSLVDRRIRSRQRVRHLVRASLSWMMIPAVPLAHLVYLACLASATLLRQVGWRGVTYRFRGPWDVRMLEYHPFQAAGDGADRMSSLV